MSSRRGQIEDWLRKLDAAVESDDGRYTLRRGSARVEVSFLGFARSEVVQVLAFTNVGLMPTPELFRYVALNADGFAFGHLGAAEVGDGTLALTMSFRLLADRLDFEELE